MSQTIQMPNIPPPLPGYPELAHVMGKTPEHAIFRTFSQLAAKSLLYSQSKLWGLEEDLRLIEQRDFDLAKQDPTLIDSTTELDCLESDPTKHAQKGVYQQFQLTLREYREFAKVLGMHTRKL